jgi:hypothetical protein
VVFSGPGAPARVERMPANDLGTETSSGGPPRNLGAELARAEQVLVDVIAGARAPGDAREQLAAYRTWLDQSPLVRMDLESRAGAFMQWLDARE